MPASPGVLAAEQLQQLLLRLVLRHDAVLDVRPVEARDEVRGVRQVAAGRRSRAWVASVAVAVSAMRGTAGQRSCSADEREVVGPEVVAPLRRRSAPRRWRTAAIGAAVEEAAASTRRAAAPARGRAGRARRRGRRPRPGARSAGSCVELRNAARTPSADSASTWSCISAMSGEMTTPMPSRTSAGIW